WLKPDKQKELIMALEENKVDINTLKSAGIKPKYLPKLRQYQKLRSEMMDRIWQELNKRGLLNEYIENYVSHIYKDPEKASSLMSDVYQRRPLSGSKYFTKQRKIPTYREAMELGLEPKYTNPVELDTAYIGQALKLIRTHDMINELKDNGFWKFVRKGQRPEEGWTKVDDPIANVWFRGKEGMVHAGDYYAPAPVARLLNNMASVGLFGRSHIFDALRQTNNFLNMIQLGISAFHGTFSVNTYLGHNFGLALSEIMTKRKRLSGMQRMITKGIPGINIPALIKDLNEGRKLVKALLRPEDVKTQKQAQFVELAKMANVDPKLDRMYMLGAIENWKKAFKQMNIPKTVTLAPAAIVETAAAPIMRYMVPWLKMKTMADTFATEVARLKPKTELEMREIAVRSYDMIEDRFGQMTYDNIFWNRTVKDTAMIALRAVGWNYGDIREVVGAGANLIDIAQKVRNGEIPKPKDISQRTYFVAGMLITQAIMGAILSYLYGQKPQSLLDYFAPRTGNKNPDGSDERIIPASYVKDWLAFSHEGTLRTLRNKLSPVINATIELINNEDYWGREIYSKDSSAWEIAKDIGKFVAEQFKPFSLQGYQRMKEHGASDVGALMPMFGFPVAPSYLARSPIQQYIYEKTREMQGVKHKELANRYQARQELKKALKKGDILTARQIAQEGLKKGYFTQKGFKRTLKNLNTPPDISLFKMLPPELQARALTKAESREEISRYLPAMSKP
ncbi:MAG: hypothetical protein D6726_05915, partial [Nitrospirae bacterium]